MNSSSHLRMVSNPKIIYEIIPLSCIDGVRVNRQGFRDSDFVKKKEAILIRIAMLGDSITQGPFVSFGETFSDQLEALLNKKAKETGHDLRYEVMNFGVTGYNLEAEVETLKTKVLQYSPDIVVLNFFHNDNDALPGMGGLFGDENDERQKLYLYKRYYLNRNLFKNFFIREILHKSKLYLCIAYRMNILRKHLSEMNIFVEKNMSSLASDGKNSIFYSNLLEIERLKEKYNFDFLICIHSHFLDGEHPNNKKFADLAKSFNFPYFHMYEYYKKEIHSSEDIRAKKGDSCHPNALGHSIIARAIFIELKKNQFINNAL